MRYLALWGATFAVGLVGCSSSSDAPGRSSGQAGSPGAPGGSGTNGAGNSSGGDATLGGSATQGSAGTTGGTSAGAATAGSNAGGANTTGGSAAGGASSCGTATPLSTPALTACPAPAGTTPPDNALAAVNDLRAHMGLACMTIVAQINTSSQKHCDYYQQNVADKSCIANAHEEVATCAGFVASSFADRMKNAGYTGSPRSEVMAFSGDPVSALGQWINSVYHRTPLLSPWIREMGYGMTADCDTIDMGVGPKTPDDATAVYPYPGQTNVPLNFDGSHEGPTPPKPPTGWPSASPVHLFAKAYTVTSHDVFVQGTCDPLPHQWLPDKDQYIFYPDKPFTKNTQYHVVIKGTKAGKELDFDWTFTTKP